MEYDFYGLCDDQGEKLKKRLTSLQKAFLQEYMKGLNLINNEQANDNREAIHCALNAALSSAFEKADIAFVACKHQVISIMEQNL